MKAWQQEQYHIQRGTIQGSEMQLWLDSHPEVRAELERIRGDSDEPWPSENAKLEFMHVCACHRLLYFSALSEIRRGQQRRKRAEAGATASTEARP